MSKLRDAAGMFVEQGRAIGAAEVARSLANQLQALAFDAKRAPTEDVGYPTRLVEALDRLATTYHETAASTGLLATAARSHAEELMAEMEHPGAVLARRLVAAARAARAAWRGTR